MADKTEKMKARLPRGFADRSAEDIRAMEKMTATIREVFELYGFEPVDQPLIEYTDALGKFLPDQDRPNEGVFSFQDDDEQWLSLRYDLTAPMARFVAENYERLPKPYRSYRSGWVFRNEKPGPGRFRQFMQFDADTVGTPGVAADAEMAMMMADVMEALGIPRGDYVIRVNNRKVLDGVLEAIGLGGDRECRPPADGAARHRQARQVRRRKACACCSAPAAGTAARKARAISRRAQGWMTDQLSVVRSLVIQLDCLRSTDAPAVREAYGGDRSANSQDASVSFTASWSNPRNVTMSLTASEELERYQRTWSLPAGTGTRPHPYRPLRRARPRILHRPGLRGRTAGRNPQRGGKDRALRLGRRRRAL